MTNLELVLAVITAANGLVVMLGGYFFKNANERIRDYQDNIVKKIDELVITDKETYKKMTEMEVRLTKLEERSNNRDENMERLFKLVEDIDKRLREFLETKNK